jgi:SAM-dependent methyltransferase
MTTAWTTDQIRAAWDSAAREWDEFVTPLTIPIGEALLRRVDIGPGTRLLDVATGSGAVALPAARRGAQVVAVDIAPAMVGALAARARAEGLANLEGRVMDGQALDLTDGSFDVSACLGGMSSFPDVTRGLAELVRVTRVGGQVVIGEYIDGPRADFYAFFLGALRAAVPGFALPTDPLTLVELSDPDVLHQLLIGAGLTGVTVATVTCDLPFGSADHFLKVATASDPSWAELVGGLPPEQLARVRQMLDGMLRERSGSGPAAVLRMDVNIGIGMV